MSRRHPRSDPVWVFDVDGTIADSLTGTSLRPGTGELLGALVDAGCSILLWSAGGADYARRKAELLGIDGYVAGYHAKGVRRGGRYEPAFLVDWAEATFVDDHPEDLAPGLLVLPVRPYLSHNPHDSALCRITPPARQHEPG